MKKSWILIFFLSSIHAAMMTAPAEPYNLSDWAVHRNHTGVPPFLCEFGYRTFADHVIDPTHRDFDPESVMPGDIIYLAVWYLDWFVEKVHDQIPNPYILLTCDVGAYIPNLSHIKLLYDPKVRCWFAKNMLFTNHKKLFQLPMGQCYFLWIHGFDAGTLSQIVQNLPLEKKHLLYLNYTERDHGRRIEVAEQFWNKPYCYNRNRPRQICSMPTFWEEVAQSKFVLSPLGLEIDCTRTWECFVLNSIPVVEHSFLDPLYENLRILLVYDWEEVDENYLNQKYAEIQARPHHLEKAYLSYWHDFILKKQSEIRAGVNQAKIKENDFSTNDLKTIKSILKKHGKTEETLVYRGNLTYLRPYQLADFLPSLPEIEVYDLWTEKGYKYLKQHCHSSLLSNKRVKVMQASNQRGKPKSYFLDLTHFRHSLFSSLRDFRDTQHNLEEAIRKIYKKLPETGILFGNMSQDEYVQKVLGKLQTKHHLKIKQEGDFWYCEKGDHL
jgi:hypothetical protein